MNPFDIQDGDRVKSKVTGQDGVIYATYFDPVIHEPGEDLTVYFKAENGETFSEEIENLEHVSFKKKEYSDEPTSMEFAVNYVGRVCESLVENGIEFSVRSRVGSDGRVEIRLLKWPEDCPPELAFIRAKNHAKYWVDEAPYRFAPNNSSDDYSRSKYPSR